MFKLPDGNLKTTGVEFRNIISQLSDNYKKDVAEAAAKLDQVTGLKSINTKEIEAVKILNGNVLRKNIKGIINNEKLIIHDEKSSDSIS